MKRVETYCIILLTIIMLSSCESNIQRRESSSFVVGTSECESETSEVIEKEENNSREACEHGELSVVYELATFTLISAALGISDKILRIRSSLDLYILIISFS